MKHRALVVARHDGLARLHIRARRVAHAVDGLGLGGDERRLSGVSHLRLGFRV